MTALAERIRAESNARARWPRSPAAENAAPARSPHPQLSPAPCASPSLPPQGSPPQDSKTQDSKTLLPSHPLPPPFLDTPAPSR